MAEETMHRPRSKGRRLEGELGMECSCKVVGHRGMFLCLEDTAAQADPHRTGTSPSNFFGEMASGCPLRMFHGMICAKPGGAARQAKRGGTRRKLVNPID